MIVAMHVGPGQTVAPLKGLPRRLSDPCVLIFDDPGDHRMKSVVTQEEHRMGDSLADLPFGMGRQAKQTGSKFDPQDIVDLPRAKPVGGALDGLPRRAPIVRVEIPEQDLFFPLRHDGTP